HPPTNKQNGAPSSLPPFGSERATPGRELWQRTGAHGQELPARERPQKGKISSHKYKKRRPQIPHLKYLEAENSRPRAMAKECLFDSGPASFILRFQARVTCLPPFSLLPSSAFSWTVWFSFRPSRASVPSGSPP